LQLPSFQLAALFPSWPPLSRIIEREKERERERGREGETDIGPMRCDPTCVALGAKKRRQRGENGWLLRRGKRRKRRRRRRRRWWRRKRRRRRRKRRRVFVHLRLASELISITRECTIFENTLYADSSL